MSVLSLTLSYLELVDVDELQATVSALMRADDPKDELQEAGRKIVDLLVPEELLPVWQSEADAVLDQVADRITGLVLALMSPKRPRRTARLVRPARKALRDLRDRLEAQGLPVPEKITAALAAA